jgi:hypothetical protein
MEIEEIEAEMCGKRRVLGIYTEYELVISVFLNSLCAWNVTKNEYSPYLSYLPLNPTNLMAWGGLHQD